LMWLQNEQLFSSHTKVRYSLLHYFTHANKFDYEYKSIETLGYYKGKERKREIETRAVLLDMLFTHNNAPRSLMHSKI